MKQKDIAHFCSALIAWYRKNRRSLPWRHSADPYSIWVSEVMLQQTQVNAVLPYYRRFMQQFPTLRHLAQAELDDVLKVWEGMGYYARARHLHRAAGIILQKHSGVIPSSWNEFQKLPGVGDYIAAAVLSIAFGQPHAVVDGNVKRVLARLHQIKAPVNTSTSARQFKAAADMLLDKQNPATYNQAIMELGALICKPQNPLCVKCPVRMHCQASRRAKVAQYPYRIPLRQIPQYRIAVGVVLKNNRLLITQRRPEGLLGGLWEFPGGKTKKGEKADVACVREIKEEVNLRVTVRDYLARVKHAYSHFKITMDVFCCTYVAGRVKLNGPVAHRWIKWEDLHQYPLPRANHKFLPKLEKWLRRSQ